MNKDFIDRERTARRKQSRARLGANGVVIEGELPINRIEHFMVSKIAPRPHRVAPLAQWSQGDALQRAVATIALTVILAGLRNFLGEFGVFYDPRRDHGFCRVSRLREKTEAEQQYAAAMALENILHVEREGSLARAIDFHVDS